jgi:integrase/recombinase XerC
VNTDNHLLIHRYLDSLQHVRKLSHHTVSNYARDLDELQVFCQSVDTNLTALTTFHIRKCAAQLHAKGLNARSIARKLSAWRGFFDWLSEQTTIASNPVEGIKAPKKSKPLPKAISADDAVHLVSHANPVKQADAPAQLCNLAMFELLYSSGLRVSELVSLDWQFSKEGAYTSSSWIDLKEAEVFVTGKGNKMRSVPVGKPAIDAITRWLAVRDTIASPAPAMQDAHALFLSERGTRISVRVAQLRLKAHSRALGLPTDVHPHVLRHSFASHVLQSSGDLRAVQELLGHASIAATQIYTALDFQRLAQVYDAAHPRAKKTTDRQDT